MPVHRLHLHSQNRENGSSASDAVFSLSKTICNVTSISVKHCILANEAHNIMESLNRIIVLISGTPMTLIVPPAFYSPSTLANAINLVFQNVDDPTHTYVTIATDNRSLLWTLPATVSIVEGGSLDVYIGLNESISGSFSTTPYLGSPHSIAFLCHQFDHVYSVMGGKDTGMRPFLIMPMTNGYGQHEIYTPQQLFRIQASSTVLDSIRVKLVDPATGVIQNVHHWSIELEIITN